MKLLIVTIILLGLTACNGVPTMKYCDKVYYKREGDKIKIEADCRTYSQDPIALPRDVY